MSELLIRDNVAAGAGARVGGGGIFTDQAKVDIKESVFFSNTAGQGADILISDDLNPSGVGSKVSCFGTFPSRVTFCDGLENVVEIGDNFINTNCRITEGQTTGPPNCPVDGPTPTVPTTSKPFAVPTPAPIGVPPSPPTPTCVNSEVALRREISLSNSAAFTNPTPIFICGGAIAIDSEIDISSRSIDVKCVVPRTCRLIGSQNRIFRGNPLNAIFTGIEFSDGGVTQATPSFGGAIYQTGGSLTITNSVFTNNVAQFGGAIFVAGLTATVEVTDSEFRFNQAIQVRHH